MRLSTLNKRSANTAIHLQVSKCRDVQKEQIKQRTALATPMRPKKGAKGGQKSEAMGGRVAMFFFLLLFVKRYEKEEERRGGREGEVGGE